MDWSRRGVEESLKLNKLPCCFSVTSATGKLKLIHLSAESGICPSVRPSVHPPFHLSPPTNFPVQLENFNPRLQAAEKSGKHVDCFSSKGAESKEPDTVSQSEVFSISAGGFLLVGGHGGISIKSGKCDPADGSVTGH